MPGKPAASTGRPSVTAARSAAASLAIGSSVTSTTSTSAWVTRPARRTRPAAAFARGRSTRWATTAKPPTRCTSTGPSSSAVAPTAVPATACSTTRCPNARSTSARNSTTTTAFTGPPKSPMVISTATSWPAPTWPLRWRASWPSSAARRCHRAGAWVTPTPRWPWPTCPMHRPASASSWPRAKRLQFPLSSFHFGSGYTSRGKRRYVFTWNRDKFPDPAGLLQAFRDAGVRTVANIKPCLLDDHPAFPAIAAAGGFDPGGGRRDLPGPSSGMAGARTSTSPATAIAIGGRTTCSSRCSTSASTPAGTTTTSTRSGTRPA